MPTSLLNSINIPVILSVPRPSLYAKFIGHILSIIISIVLDNPSPVLAAPPFAPPEGGLLVVFDIVGDFFVAFVPVNDFLLPEEDALVELLFNGELVDEVNVFPLLNLFLLSYTKSIAS